MIKAAIAEMTKDQLRAEPFDIKVGNTGKANPSQLFMDRDALKNAPTKEFSGKQRKAFESIFSTVQTKYTKNVANMQQFGQRIGKTKRFLFPARQRQL